jgi:hypothetical protein
MKGHVINMLTKCRQASAARLCRVADVLVTLKAGCGTSQGETLVSANS